MIFSVTKHTSTAKILIGILYLIIVNVIVFPLFPQLFDTSLPIKSILDLKFGFDKQTVITSFEILSYKQLHTYLLSTTFIDIPYALTYWIVYAMIIYVLLKKIEVSNKFKYLLVYIPVIISISDVIENIGIISIISKYPDIPNWLIDVTSIFNKLKWSAASITFLIIISLLLMNILTNKGK